MDSTQQQALWPHGSVQITSTLGGRSVEAVASDILASAPLRFQLAAISLGGYLAFEILRQAPERVERLALLDTTARPDTPEQTAGRREMLAVAADDFLEVAVDGLTAVLHPARRDDANLRDLNRRMAHAVGLTGFASQTEVAITRPDSRPGLTGINVPTLVVVGDSDGLTPPALSEEIAGSIPGARHLVIADCGHASTIEQPEQVNQALVDWFVAERR